MRSRILSALVAVLLTMGATVVSGAPTLVCVDAGHGGTDPGAVGCGLEEAEVTLEVALRLKALLQSDPDLEPVLTRTTDTYVSLDARTSFANDQGAARFASIHCNASDGTASGIETYAYTYGSTTSFNQRDHIQDALTATWPTLPDRGGKTANFYVIKYTSMPATLSELAFIDHCTPDAKLLASTAERQRAAEAHHAALRASLGLPALSDPGTDPVVDPDTKGVLRGVVFEDQGVGASDMSIRLPAATVTASGPAGSGATQTDAPTASWALSLPAGAYTVTASKAGYVTTSRDCDVTAGGEEWCSIGLAPTSTVTPPTAKGRLVGVIYEVAADGSGDMSVRLPGASVAAAGPGSSSASTTASGADAAWALDVPVGTWVVTASAAGHDPATRVCTVEPDSDTWCSLGLASTATTPPTPTGTLKGVAYLLGPGGPDDMSDRLPGALVRAKGPDGVVRERIAPFPDAMWAIEAPEGEHVVWAVLDGYTSEPLTCTVVKGDVTWCSTGLKLGQSIDPGTTPGGANGTLGGIVYQLSASDPDDQGTRLPGAIVTLTGAQGVAGALVAGEGEARWSKSVPPGQYFVVAALDGFLSTGRTCTVLSDQDTWCPVGLAPVGSTPVDPGTPDVVQPPDTSHGDDDPTAPDGPDVAPDVATHDTAPDGSFGYTIEVAEPEPDAGASGGCALQPRGPGSLGALALLAALALLLVRGRARRALPLLALVALVPVAARAEPTEPLHLANVQVLTPAQGFTQPVWSPDGTRLAVAGPGFASLWLLEVPERALTRLAEGPQSGLNPVFSPAGDRLGVRAPGQRGGDVPLGAVTLRDATPGSSGVESTAPVANPTPGRWLVVRDDRVWLRVGSAEAPLSSPGQRACCGTLSPDGRWAAWLDLARGVMLADTATGRTHALGTGTHPRFDAAGRHLAFQRCADDGRALTGCTLHLVDLTADTPSARAIAGAPALATHPALAPDGRTLAFEVDGAIWVGTLEP